MWLTSQDVHLRPQNVVELTNKNFDDLVGQDKAVVLDFYAPCARRSAAARCSPYFALRSAPMFSPNLEPDEATLCGLLHLGRVWPLQNSETGEESIARNLLQA